MCPQQGTTRVGDEVTARLGDPDGEGGSEVGRVHGGVVVGAVPQVHRDGGVGGVEGPGGEGQDEVAGIARCSAGEPFGQAGAVGGGEAGTGVDGPVGGGRVQECGEVGVGEVVGAGDDGHRLADSGRRAGQGEQRAVGEAHDRESGQVQGGGQVPYVVRPVGEGPSRERVGGSHSGAFHGDQAQVPFGEQVGAESQAAAHGGAGEEQ